jgi:hypothetical protein
MLSDVKHTEKTINNRLAPDYLASKSDTERFLIILFSLFVTSLVFYFSGIHDYFIADSLVGLNLKWSDAAYELTSQGAVFGYRPMGVAWFVLNNSLWGDWAFGHRIMALALHAANGAMLFLIAYRLKNNLLMASLAALLFITLPVQVETVQWLAALAGSATSTFFFLLSCWIWIKPQDFPNKTGRFLSAVFFLFALLTKEISAALPLTLLLFDWYLKKVKPPQTIVGFLKWFISYWPLAASFLIYFLGSYATGTFNTSYEATASGYNNFFALIHRFDQFFNVMAMPVSGFIEWRLGALAGLWITVFVVLLHISKSARVFFTLTLINLFPGIFYFADRLTYLPVAFWSLGLSILLFNLIHFLQKHSSRSGLKLFIKTAAILGVVLLLVMNYRFVQRRLEPWSNAARLCKTIPEKVYQLLPDPEPGAQLILVDMTFSPGIPVSLWALFAETERCYNRPDLEIRQIYEGPDVLNLINIKSIPCESERTRYFVKYFQKEDSVGFAGINELRHDCPE